jgi:threonine dehydratase
VRRRAAPPAHSAAASPRPLFDAAAFAAGVDAADVYGGAVVTPLEAAPRLSAATGLDAAFKREDLQPVRSFKIRGACAAMSALPDADRRRGVIAASAGNHAQGVAYAARSMGADALIVMPATTPSIKTDAVAALGAAIELAGDTYAEAAAYAADRAAHTGRVFIHAFDDPAVVAGQGTVAAEIDRQRPGRLDAVFVPVGGGGLIAGVAGYLAARRPEAEVIGVEPFEADAMFRSLAAGRRVPLDRVGIFADGVAVSEVGAYTFPIAAATVSRIIRVDNDAICAAIRDVYNDTRSIVEPAGALAVAGLSAWAREGGHDGASAVAVLSGANMNFERLRFVAERADLGEHREVLLGVTIPERPGAFLAFCAALGRRTVTEFNYRLASRDAAHIFVGIATASAQDGRDAAARIAAAGYAVTDLSGSEMAKLHVRHMVGGRSAAASGERLYRFEFPERPGALLSFLEVLGGRWNISLFHYRNHGADYGRVLAGFEVPDADMPAFAGFLAATGYPFADETGNDAYRLFL